MFDSSIDHEEQFFAQSYSFFFMPFEGLFEFQSGFWSENDIFHEITFEASA